MPLEILDLQDLAIVDGNPGIHLRDPLYKTCLYGTTQFYSHFYDHTERYSTIYINEMKQRSCLKCQLKKGLAEYRLPADTVFRIYKKI
jgi:hypothetical protein